MCTTECFFLLTSGSFVDTGNNANVHKVTLVDLAVGMDTLAVIGSIDTTCSNRTAMQMMQMTPDKLNLVTGCMGSHLDIFDVSNITDLKFGPPPPLPLHLSSLLS